MNIEHTVKSAGKRGAHRPFGGPPAPKQKSKPLDPATLLICDDPIPTHRASSGNKYGALLEKMKVGQCIKCLPADVGRMSCAVKKHIETKKIKATVRTMSDYGDGMARVWMIQA
jgi:hypothetical protein